MNALKRKGIFTWLSVPTRSHLVIIIVLAILILLTPIVYRAVAVDGAVIGSESYDNLYWANQPFEVIDSLDYSNDPYVGERGWFAILSLAPLFFSKWLPFVLGLFSIVLFYFIVKKIKKEYAFLATIVLLFSPLTIYLYSVSSKFVMAFFLFLLCSHFYLSGKKAWAMFCVFLLSFFSFAVAVVIWLGWLGYLVYVQKRGLARAGYLFGSLIVSFFIQFGYLLSNYGIPQMFFISDLGLGNLLGSLFVDLGALQGFGLFFFILALFGIYFTFEKKFKYVLVYIGLILALFISLQFDFLLYFINFVLAFFVAVALIEFIKKEWKLDIAKKLGILFLICGLLFSFVAFMNVFVDGSPDQCMEKGVKYLDVEGKDYVVLSDPDRAGYIKYGGNVPLVSDKVFYYSSPQERLEDISWFYTLNSFGNVEDVIVKYGITLIWIDEEMKDRIWAGSETDLLYLMDVGFKKFFKAYSSDTLEIWEYMGD